MRKEVVMVYRCQVSFGEALVIQSRSSINEHGATWAVGAAEGAKAPRQGVPN